MLNRGNYDQKLDQVERKVPAALPPLPEAAPNNRLGLAQWLVDPANPLTGVFATHSPRRPNPIALSRCRIREVTLDGILVDQIDALDGSPVIDIKSFFPLDDEGPVKVPDWQ